MNRKKIIIFAIIVILLLAAIAGSIVCGVLLKNFIPALVTTILIILMNIACAWRIISSKRTFLAKSCWLLVIICLPAIGLIVFLIFGINPIKARSKKQYFNDQEDVIKTEDYSFTKEALKNPETSRLFEFGYFSMHKPVYKNNHFELIEDNTQLFEKSIQLIRSAQETINIQSFIFNYSGFWTKILFAELIKKANQGIKVRLLYDWMGSWHRIKPKIYRQLVKYGIEVACFNPKGLTAFKGATNYRLHTKFIIVDNKVALYGGSNFADEYLSMHKGFEHWKDLNFVITGPIVNSMNTTFVNYWLSFTEWSTSETSKQNLRNDIDIIFKKNEFKPSNVAAQLLIFEPDFNEFAMENTLLNAIYNSNKSIRIITPYFCPPNKIVEALLKKSLEGLDVEVIVHNKNQKYVQIINNENLSKLLEGGVKVYQYDGYLHSKLNIFDDKYVLTGSCNIDYRSIYLDFESWITVYQDEFTKTMINYFNNCKKNTIVLDNEQMKKQHTPWKKFLCKILNIAKSTF